MADVNEGNVTILAKTAKKDLLVAYASIKALVAIMPDKNQCAYKYLIVGQGYEHIEWNLTLLNGVIFNYQGEVTA